MSAARKPYRVERRISWMECDRSGRIRHQVVFDWVVDAEVALLRAAGVLDEVYDDLPRVAVEARYLVPLGFDDPVALELSVTELGRQLGDLRLRGLARRHGLRSRNRDGGVRAGRARRRDARGAARRPRAAAGHTARSLSTRYGSQ